MASLTGMAVLATCTLGGLLAYGANAEEWVRAERAIDMSRLSPRQAFKGGWPMGISGSTCPVGLTLCSGSISNPSCCPAGSYCAGFSNQFCCPETEKDCEKFVDNFPQCADPKLTLYVLSVSSKTYFCCPAGQFGVLPLTGYGGYCQENGSPVDATRIAVKALDLKTVVDFVTSVIVTGSTSTTLANGDVTQTVRTFSSRTTVTETKNQFGPSTIASGVTNTDAPSQTSSKSPSDPATNPRNPDNGGGISAGAIAGIVIGALAVVAIFTLAWVLYRRKKPAGNPDAGAGGLVGGESPSPTYTGYKQPSEQQPQMTNYPIPVTHQSPGDSHAGLYSSTSGYSPAQGTMSPQYTDNPPPPAGEVSAGNNWNDRAELGSGR